jgi:CheY-like chemotaxis protein
MARILISEPREDVRRLLVRMLERLGHEPVVVTVPAPEQLAGVEALVVEPAAPIGVVLAQAVRLIDPSLPLICASVTAPPPELAELGVVFAAVLIKPFTAEQLGAAIARSLSARQRQDRHAFPRNEDRAA